jgi:hypothetical protein
MRTNARIHRIAIGSCVALLLAACQTSPPRNAGSPGLQLIGTAPLSLPQDCSPSGSIVVDFTVRADGRTSAIEPKGEPACARAALTAWVESFRYSPPDTETRTHVEWLLVEAKRGS